MLHKIDRQERAIRHFLKSVEKSSAQPLNTLTQLSVHNWKMRYERNRYLLIDNKNESPQCSRWGQTQQHSMLYLRLDQALELLGHAETLREKLVVRYFQFNGLSPMELANARIEHLDPVENTLYMPKRHWKRNCVADIDPETVRLQILYSGDRTQGPLIRARKGKQPCRATLNVILKHVADRTNIPNRHAISPIVLKRTFAREWLLSKGSVGSLQKQFSHKHLWSTAHYLRFDLSDVKQNHGRFMNHVEGAVANRKRR